MESRKIYLNLVSAIIFASLSLSAKSENTTYVVTNAQGTIVAEMDKNKNVTYSADYRPYGIQSLGATKSGPGYTGHVNDPETTLIYMQQRYYDPSSGRFISLDPIPPEESNLFSFNRYTYGNNDPVNHTDPDGRYSCDQCDDISGISGFTGIQLRTAGIVRQQYVVKSSRLRPEQSTERSALKQEARERTPSMIRRAVEAARPSTEAPEGSGGRANSTNLRANSIGENFRGAGNVLLVGSAAVSAYQVATADNKSRALAGAGGGMLGGIGGGETGSWAGAGIGFLLGGPPGAAVGAIIGGLGGSAVGAHYGSKMTVKIYDKVNE